MAEKIESVGVINIETKNAEKSVGSLKRELRETTERMKELASAGDRTSEEYKKLAQRAGELARAQREVAKDVSEASTTFSNTVQYTAGALSGVSAGVQTVTSALSLLGVQTSENEKLMKTLVSAMALTSGLQGIQNSIEAFKMLYNNIKRSTIAQKALNLAMKANPAMLAVGAITALVGIIATLTMKMNDNKKATDDLTESNKKLIDSYRNLNDELSSFGDELDMNSSTWMENVIKKYKEFNVKAGGNIDSLRSNIKIFGEEAVKNGDVTAKNLAVAIDAYLNLIEARMQYEEAIRNGDKEQIENAKKVVDAQTKTLSTIYKEQTKKVSQTTTKVDIYTDYEKELNRLKLLREEDLIDERIYTDSLIKLETERLRSMKAGTKEYDEQLIKVAELRSKSSEIDGSIEKAVTLGVTTDETVKEIDDVTEAVNDLQEAINGLREPSLNDVVFEWWGKYGDTVGSVTSSITGYLNQLSQDEDISFENQKKIKKASAIISTIQGAIEAYMQAQKLGVPLGMAVGAVNASAVLATGIAQVRQIEQTTKNSSNVATSSYATSAIQRNYTNALLTDGTGSEYNLGDIVKEMGDKKVYVSAREITDVQNNMKQVEVRNRW